MKELAEAEDDFKHGRVYSSDDLRKEMKTWNERCSVPPCQFTPDELRADVRIAMEQSRQGLGLTNDEMLNRKRPWRES